MAGTIKPFSPGSKDAIAAGCLCPVIDNCRGQGAYQKEDGTPVFWHNNACPIHGKAEDIDPQTVLTEIDLE